VKSLIILIVVFFLSLHFVDIYGQKTIKGRIIDEYLEIISAGKIYDADTILLGETDLNGYFEISIPEKSKEIILCALEYEWATITIPDNCEYFEVILFVAGTYDFMSARKVDRLRKKDFNKLAELHLKAFNQGLFISSKLCYLRKFQPDKPILDKIHNERIKESKLLEKTFEDLTVGDTIRIPYRGTWIYEDTDKKTLELHSYSGNGKDYVCAIKGVIIDKNKHKNGYNLVLSVIDYKDCNCNNIVLYGKELKVGELIEYNMKYFKILNNN
jgi:hypothetical protein